MAPGPDSIALAALEAVVIAGGLIAFGYLLAATLLGSRQRDPLLAWGLAFTALLAYVLVLMLLHMITGGRVLGEPALVRGATATLATVLVLVRAVRRRPSPDSRRLARSDVVALAALFVLGLLLWGSPLARMLPVGHVGDQNLHMGWAGQLLNGEAVPSAALTGDIPNFYPWLFHALVAFTAHFTTGGRAFHAQAALQVLQVTGAVLTLYALGRRVGRGWMTGAAAALFGALSGGLGFVLLRRPDFVVEVRPGGGSGALRYLGDLLYRRSYNLSFHNLVPVFPRDVAFVLTAAFLLLLVSGVITKRLVFFAGAGVVLGLIGLTGGETFIVGAGTAATLSLLISGISRLRVALALFVPTVGLSALWLAPLAVNYLELGGFVNTASPPVALPPLAILGAWGIATPFALYALLGWRREAPDHRWKPLLALLLTAVALVVVSGVVPALFGEGFTTLGLQHRYWPLVHLAIALLAAVGVSRALERVRQKSRAGAVAVVVVVVGLAIPSPLLASIAFPDKLPPEPTLTDSLLGEARTSLNLLAEEPGAACVLAVPHGRAMRLFGYSGYRFVSFPYSLESPERARIRWRLIYERIRPPSERRADNRVLTRAIGPAHRWESVAQDYGVDRVLVDLRRQDAEALRGHHVIPVNDGYGEAAVVQSGGCG